MVHFAFLEIIRKKGIKLKIETFDMCGGGAGCVGGRGGKG
jgi:hypothetical protein